MVKAKLMMFALSTHSLPVFLSHALPGVPFKLTFIPSVN